MENYRQKLQEMLKELKDSKPLEDMNGIPVKKEDEQKLAKLCNY